MYKSFGSATDIVITPINNPSAIKNAKTKKECTKCGTNTCHTLVKDLFTPSHCNYPTSCSSIKVQQQSEEVVSEADFELKEFTTFRILNLKKYNAPDFGLEKTQRVGILKKNFDKSDFEKMFALKNHVLVHFSPPKRHILPFLSFFRSLILS